MSVIFEHHQCHETDFLSGRCSSRAPVLLGQEGRQALQGRIIRQHQRHCDFWRQHISEAWPRLRRPLQGGK